MTLTKPEYFGECFRCEANVLLEDFREGIADWVFLESSYIPESDEYIDDGALLLCPECFDKYNKGELEEQYYD